MPVNAPIKITHAEWKAEGLRRFGADLNAWRFVCPCCKHVASIGEWRAAGAGDGEAAFSCIGRRVGAKRQAFGDGPGPCNYAGGGLFQLNPVHVDCGDAVIQAFAFAEEG